VSDPSASGVNPAATATADPPLDPPGVRSVSQGLREGPKAECSVDDPIANSSQFVLPSTTAPAVSRRATTVASYGGWKSPRMREPAVARMPRTQIVSFTPTGAAAVLRRPLDALANATVDLADLDGPRGGAELAGFNGRLAEAADHAARLRLVEELLLDLAGAVRADPLVAVAAEMLERSREAVRIAALARRIGLSQSALERRNLGEERV